MFAQKAFTQAAFSIQGNFCQNNTLQFVDETVVAVSVWNWNFGDGDSSLEQNPSHTYSDTGTYNITLVVVSNGNTYNTNQNIRIAAIPIVNFTIDSTQFITSTYKRVFTDSSKTYNPASSYIWDFGDGSVPVTTPLKSTLYQYNDKGAYTVWLKVIDNKDCTDSISKNIDIYDRFYIPNVFTPNGDLVNDEFIVTSNGITLFSIEIYSRWGNLVFKRDGHEQIVWDGTMPDGSPVKSGTYFYVINSESGNTTYEPEKGFITVFTK